MDKIKLPQAGPCQHCGHVWVIRKPQTPLRCGRCKRKWKKGEKKK